MLKIIFLGTPNIGASALKSLLNSDKLDVVAVVTGNDKPTGRSHSALQESPVASLGHKYGLNVVKTDSINRDIGKIANLGADYLLTCAFGQFLSDEVLNVPNKKALNVHGSLLPEGRGGAPLHWAIINGKKETGFSMMEMVSKMDAGDYYSQSIINIREDDTVDDLFDNMSQLIEEEVADSLIEIDNGLKPIKQDESKVTFWMNVKKEDSKVSFDREGQIVYNHIRGLTSKPGAWANIDDKVIKFNKTRLASETSDTTPGTIYKIDNGGMYISTKDNSIIVKEYTISGSKRIIVDKNNSIHLINKVII